MTIDLSDYQARIADYWNTENNAVNHQLGAIDGLTHHHYGLGDPDEAVDPADGDAVTAELHRLEHNQATCLIDHLGPLGASDRALDAGCGHGATAIMVNARFGCHVEGITLSQRQADAANAEATRRGVTDTVAFRVANMLDTPYDDQSFTTAWNNESTMYVDLDDLYSEISRLIKRRGRYVVITGCTDDAYGLPSKHVNYINYHYECNVHSRSDYLTAMLRHRLVPTDIIDLTELTVPYWRLRAASALATGIEAHFLNAYDNGGFQYLLIGATRT